MISQSSLSQDGDVARKVPSPKNGGKSSLVPRILSAVVLVPLGAVAIWLGGLWFFCLVMLVATLMAFEWNQIIYGAQSSLFMSAHLIFSIAALLAFHLGAESVWPLALISFGAVFGAGIAFLRGTNPAWPFLGVIYTATPCVCLLWLRSLPEGFLLVFGLVFVVVATDVGAYAAGRTIGGPRLAPKISPAKTWAGLGGGVFFSAACAMGIAFLAGYDLSWSAFIGACIAVVAQGGDIMESAFKRHFGVKDSGAVIPGHGGVLDRFDGLMIATVLVAFLLLWVDGSILNFS